MEELIRKWESILHRKLTEDEILVIELTEGEIDLRLGYCPSIFGGSVDFEGK